MTKLWIKVEKLEENLARRTETMDKLDYRCTVVAGASWLQVQAGFGKATVGRDNEENRYSNDSMHATHSKRALCY